MRIFKNSAGFDLNGWLRQGISPGRLGLTLALGFAIGCIPVVGVPTVLCAALALLFRLNQPAIGRKLRRHAAATPAHHPVHAPR